MIAFKVVSTDIPVETAFAVDFERFFGAILIGKLAVLASTVAVEVTTL